MSLPHQDHEPSPRSAHKQQGKHEQRHEVCKSHDDFGELKAIATCARSVEGKTFAVWTAKNDNHEDRTKILNWLDERLSE